ncbi:COX15/CtaA family protein [Streptosporangium sp. NPDC020072]|uniref:COX15/CtaA family protein n=1 Tax=Streptosporangium sp. NPDC020072 TaxID=3154788 RepID=UPI003413D329
MNHLLDQARPRALGFLPGVLSPTPAILRRWALATVVVNVGIVVTGAVVRVTGSGLGCPTWPRCTADSFIPVAHADISPINMAVEFGNRLLSFVVLIVGLACLVSAARLRPRRRDLTTLAWIQPAGVAAQALWGGLVVRTMLNPVTVSVHFLLSIGMLAAAVVFLARAQEGDAAPEPLVHPAIRTLGLALVPAVAVLLVAGVVVTGTGPHSGDEAASRFAFDIETVARIHADVVYVVVGLTFALLFALYVTGAPAAARRAALTLLGVELAQGVIGYVQYFLALPAFLVGLHVFGSTLVWIYALRVGFTLRSRGPLGAERLASS